MSDLFQQSESSSECVASPCNAISLLIQPRETDLGGFSVRRYLPHAKCRKVGPFIFFDHMGPADFAPGEGIDVRPHPHIGLATITYLFEGEMIHRDSLGCVQAITPGAVNWMTAGRGIVHSERTGEEARASGQRMNGLQIWIGLPEAFEKIEPEFHHHEDADLPVIHQGETSLRLIAGSAFGETSPVKTYSPLFYLDVRVPAGGSVTLPDEHAERAVYLVSGQLQAKDTVIDAYHMVIFDETKHVELTAVQDARLVIFGGAPISHRHIWWNFVSSSKERIEQAKSDWKGQRFDDVPGDSEFIPLPE